MARYTDIKKMKLLDPTDQFDYNDINSNFQKVLAVYPMNPKTIKNATSEALIHGWDDTVGSLYNDIITLSWKVLIYADGRFEAVCKFNWTKSIYVSTSSTEMFEHATYRDTWNYWCVKVTLPSIWSGGVKNVWIEPNVVVGTNSEYPNGRSVWPTQTLMTSDADGIYGHFGLNTIGNEGKLGVPLTIHLYATGKLNGYSDSMLTMLNAADPVDVDVYNSNFKLLDDVKKQNIIRIYENLDYRREFTGEEVKRTYYGLEFGEAIKYSRTSLRPWSSSVSTPVGYVYESQDIDLTGAYDANNVFIINSYSFVKMGSIANALIEGSYTSDCVRSRIRIKNNNFCINSIGLSSPSDRSSKENGRTVNLTFISLS